MPGLNVSLQSYCPLISNTKICLEDSTDFRISSTSLLVKMQIPQGCLQKFCYQTLKELLLLHQQYKDNWFLEERDEIIT